MIKMAKNTHESIVAYRKLAINVLNFFFSSYSTVYVLHLGEAKQMDEDFNI